MSFHFPLERLLRYCQAREHREENAFAALAHQAASLRAEIERWLDHERQLRDSFRRPAKAILPAITLQFAETRGELVREKVAAFRKQLAQLEERRELQRQQLLSARREREALSTLRARQQERYRREQNKREQQEIDEMFLIRYAGKRH